MSDYNQQNNFSMFGKGFQENLLNIILHDRLFGDQIGEILETSFFEEEYLQVVASKIYNYKKQYKEHPTIETMKAILTSELGKENEALQKQVKEFFVKIAKNKEVENASFIMDKSLDFCKKQSLRVAIIKSIDLLPKASFDEISVLINDALKLGLNNDIGYEYIKDFEERYKPNHRAPITSGWEEFDGITGGGLGSGDLGVVMAPTGVGKSLVMVHLAAQALREGKTVFYYTLELSDAQVSCRFDAHFAEVSLSDLKDYKEQILECIKKIPGTLITKYFPMRSISTLGIRNHLEKAIQRGIKPDLILVDYADLLKTTTNYKERRHELENTYEELKGIAQFYQIACWTATQTNRSGASAEVLDMTHIAEAYNKAFPADLIIALSRTDDDKNACTGRFHILKNRFGPDSQVYDLYFDSAKVNIRILGEKAFNPEEEGKSALLSSYKQKLREEQAKNKT